MKIRTDIVKMYKEVHSWVGIFAGLCLFIAFYAGAVTMFEAPIQRWASPPVGLPAPVPMERAPELVDKVLAAHPEAAEHYSVNVRIDGNRPARVMWEADRPGGAPGEHVHYFAALDDQDRLQVSTQKPSPVGEFFNLLHQKIGLPVPRAVAMPVMGIVALLYAIAIASGVVALLPSLIKDLFALRLGKNLKRMWLDVHNVLGLFSLPFHIVMAISSVGFAFFPYWYQTQTAAFDLRVVPEEHAIRRAGPFMAPADLVSRVQAQAPGFQVAEISYAREADGSVETHVSGPHPGHTVRIASGSIADVDAYTGMLTSTDFMPGLRRPAGEFGTSYISLHFGNYGGDPIRWAYFLLGLAGAALFYTGNLLWIESRRRKERKAGLPEQTRATRILGALTVGVPLGCIAGISITLAAAKLLGGSATAGLHSAIYYAIFLTFSGYALWRGAARAGVELAGTAAAATLVVPLVSVIAGARWYQNGASVAVDAVAIAIAGALVLAMVSAYRRVKTGPRDSIWAASAAA